MATQLKLKRRGKRGMLYLVRHVPVDYRGVEARKEVWVPLKTDSETLAQQKASQIWDKTVAGWEARKAGGGLVRVHRRIGSLSQPRELQH